LSAPRVVSSFTLFAFAASSLLLFVAFPICRSFRVLVSAYSCPGPLSPFGPSCPAPRKTKPPPPRPPKC
jgi:hypothetical protein